VGRVFARRGYVTAVVSYRLSRMPLAYDAIVYALLAAITTAALYALRLAAAAAVAVVGALAGADSDIVVQWQWEQWVRAGQHWTPAWMTPLLAIPLPPAWVLLQALALVACLAAHTRALLGPDGGEAVRHPTHVQDVAAAVAYLHAHAEALGADPSRMHLVGHSAGGHIVTMLALCPSFLAAAGLRHPAAAIAGVVGVSGAYSAARIAASPLFRRTDLASAFGPDPAAWQAAFPLAHAEAAAAALTTAIQAKERQARGGLRRRRSPSPATSAKPGGHRSSASEHALVGTAAPACPLPSPAAQIPVLLVSAGSEWPFGLQAHAADLFAAMRAAALP
jgi:hypothetical protein